MSFIVHNNMNSNNTKNLRNNINKLWLSWAKLEFSLVRAVNEVTVIFNLVEVEIEVIVELSLLVLVGGGWCRKKRN